MQTITPVEVATSIQKVGPSLVLIARDLGVSPREVRRHLRDDGAKAAYDAFVNTVLDLVDRLGSNKSLIARYFGVTRQQVAAWFTEDPRLRGADLDYYESMMDLAEWGLNAALQSGQRWAIERMFDSRYGQRRGFGKKLEIDLTVASQQLGVNLNAISEEVARRLLEVSGSDEAGLEEDE